MSELFDVTRVWLESAPKGSTNLLFFAMFCLIVFYNSLYDLCNYLITHAWEVSDLRRIVGKYLRTYDVDSHEEESIVAECIDLYNKSIDKREKRKKIIDKIKSFFKK